MTEEEYNLKVVETFGERVLRSAYVIDDQFPTYGDLINGKGDQFADIDIALELHEFFREKGIPCDVENLYGGQVSTEHIERIRKTDLIVLDYNLDRADHTDSKTAIDILGRLADTPHFNTVVLYTGAEDLNRVWREVATSLKGGWKAPKSAAHRDAYSGWLRARNRGIDTEVPFEILDAAIHGRKEAIGGAVRESYRELILQASTDEDGKPIASRNDVGLIIDELCRVAVLDILRNHHEAEIENKRDIIANRRDDIRWVQTGQCFVAIIGKPGATQGGVAPAHIMEMLHKALIDWKPSLLQIIIADIQNILELRALATEAKSLRDPNLQMGLSYYLLWSLPQDLKPGNPIELMPAVSSIVGKLVDNIRQRVCEDRDLNSSAARLVSYALEQAQWFPVVGNASWKKPSFMTAAKAMSNLVPGAGPIDGNETLLRLNSFLSSEAFLREGVTTGTVFTREGGEDCWMCLTPACDMVPREPNDTQSWMLAMHPVRPIVTVKLHEHKPANNGLGKAEDGKFVFVHHEGRGIRSFSVVEPSNTQPVVEMLLAVDAGRTSIETGSETRRFTAQRMLLSPTKDRSMLEDATFEVIGQVREAYASRFLSLVGQHVSRIGVDFVSTQKT